MNHKLECLKGMKVIIVDDTQAKIDVLRKTLEPQGFSISMAPRGDIAIKITERSLPNLILLDVMMPEMNGFETCRQIKRKGGCQDIPVVFISAKADVSDLVEGFSAGGVDYISKPFNQEEVLTRAQTHLQLRKLVKDKEDLIRELTNLKDQLELSAETDPLTGLVNRRGMQEKLNYETLRFERNKKPFCIFLSDIDPFKNVNDSYGHDVGDQVLVRVGKILIACTRKLDVVCRWGERDFLLFCRIHISKAEGIWRKEFVPISSPRNSSMRKKTYRLL